MTNEELQALLDEVYPKAMQREAEREKLIAEQAEKLREEEAKTSGATFTFDPEKNLALIRDVAEDLSLFNAVAQIQSKFGLGPRAVAAIMDYLKEKKYIRTNENGELKVAVPFYALEEICPDEDDD